MSAIHQPKPRLFYLLFASISLCSRPAHAQQSAPATAPPEISPQHVPTLDKVQALPPDEEAEALNLYQFKNPISVPPNQFNRAYDTGITPEEMALKYDGYVNYGINKGLYAAFKGLGKLTGARPQIQSVTARPPPLNVEQMDRAARLDAEGTPARTGPTRVAPSGQ